MKIIILNTVVKEGSTGKIAFGLYKYLKQCGHECLVCYGRGEKFPDDSNLIRLNTRFAVNLHTAFSRIFGLQGFFSYFATKKFVATLKRFQPNVVFLLNLHGYYIHEFKLFRELKRLKIRVIYLMLDEYPYLGKCCYSYECTRYMTGCRHCPYVKDYPKSLFFDTSRLIWRKKQKAYDNFNEISFVAPPYVIDKAAQSELLRGRKLYKIDEAVDLNFFTPRDTNSLRIQHALPEKKKIALCVARFSDPRKGVKFFLELAKMKQCEDIAFIQVGFDVSNISYPNNFFPVTYIRDQEELAMYYSLADILVCPSLSDTMPNVCLEALGCGTPVCGFDISGVPYTASPEFGTFVSFGDTDALAKVIISSPVKTSDRIASCRAYALSRFSSEMYFSKLEVLAKK